MINSPPSILHVAVPIIWIIVAALIGLSLYKSSGAVLRRGNQSRGSHFGIRLTGSAAIAACAFVGLWYTTTHPSNEQTALLVQQSYQYAIQMDRLSLEVLAAA